MSENVNSWISATNIFRMNKELNVQVISRKMYSIVRSNNFLVHSFKVVYSIWNRRSNEFWDFTKFLILQNTHSKSNLNEPSHFRTTCHLTSKFIGRNQQLWRFLKETETQRGSKCLFCSSFSCMHAKLLEKLWQHRKKWCSHAIFECPQRQLKEQREGDFLTKDPRNRKLLWLSIWRRRGMWLVFISLSLGARRTDANLKIQCQQTRTTTILWATGCNLYHLPWKGGHLRQEGNHSAIKSTTESVGISGTL